MPDGSASHFRTIGAQAAAALLRDGAVLIDVREPDEIARETIPGAVALPLSGLTPEMATELSGAEFVLICASGARATQAAAHFPPGQAVVVSGGLKAWKASGFSTERNAKAPLPIMRQVQMIAGGLVVAGAVLGAAIDPWFHLLSAGVGAGLLIAGVTGTCLLASLLGKAPWNRRPAQA